VCRVVVVNMPSLPPVVILLVLISTLGAIALPFGAPQFLDRAVALELSFIVLAVLTYKGFRKVLYACIPLAIIIMVGEFTCITSRRDDDNIFKTIECTNANYWWLCLVGSTYWHNHFAACKNASRHCSKPKGLDDSTKYVFL
jgi:hypothetical protein